MKPDTDILRLFSFEEITGFLCDACAMRIPMNQDSRGRYHLLNGAEIPCHANKWRDKPQVQARLSEKRSAVNMNLQAKVEGALAAIGHGWCSVEKAQTLAAAVLALRPETVVEIGVYAGRSFIPMALALQQLGHGKAIGIDPYDAAVSAAGEVEKNAEWWASFDHGQIEQVFLTAVEALELQQFVELWKKPSDEVLPPENIGLLHVDGSHTEQAIRDVTRYARNVIIGGMVCLDDILWDGGAVSQAAELLKTMGFEELYRVIGNEHGTPYSNNWCMMQRIDWVQP